MVKYLASLILVIVTVWVALKEFSVPASGVSIDIWQVVAHDFHIQEKLAKQKQFRIVFDSTLDYLAKGDIPLTAASIRVRYAGESFCPVFVQLVPKAEPSRTLNESVARNLIGHLRERSSRDTDLRCRVVALEEELAVMIAEPVQDESEIVANLQLSAQ